ncbi:MAG: FKBP-type peptidyl-prolyl cis-trans isomerase [archaeon]
MKKLILSIAAVTILFGCSKKFEVTTDGVKYRVISHSDTSRAIGVGDLLLVNLLITTEHDSVILETFQKNNPRYIPSDEPVLHNVFGGLSRGDSLEVIVNADTLFNKSFGMARPANIKAGESVHFTMKIVETFNQKEILKKRMDQQKELAVKDSLSLENFLSSLKGQDVKQAANGLRYIIEKTSTGKQVKSGDKITVKYKGTLLTGEVFDETKEGAEPFTFTVGLGQVIRGWDEGLLMMKEGEKYKFIIPPSMAYGESGSGPIPPLSTLVFDVELVKIN